MKKTTRAVLCAGPLAAASLAAACPSQSECPRPVTQTIVFYDQSASSVADAGTTAMFRDSLTSLVNTALVCEGDGVHGFLVHGATTAKVGRVDEEQKVRADTLEGTQIKKATNKTRFEQALDSLHRHAAVKLQSLQSATAARGTKMHTDLLGTLEVISDELAKVPDGQHAVVYYFGDMRESMPRPRRDFDARPPKDPAEAEQWAEADATLLAGMGVDTAGFRNAEIRVLMGSLAAKPSAGPVEAYWEHLFRKAGFSRVRFN